LSSEAFVDRVEGAAARGGLVTVATDGETFGHHHSFGDRLLAYALAVEAPRRQIDVTNVVRYLRDHPPEREVTGRRAVGHAPTASGAGGRTAAARPAAGLTGISSGGRRSAQRWTRCAATPRTCSSI